MIYCIGACSKFLLFELRHVHVKAWIKGTYRGHMPIYLHWWQQNSFLVLIPSCVSNDGPIEKLSFRRVNIRVVTAFHDYEIVTPAPSHFKVILRRWKRLWLTFLERCPSLKHHFLGVFVLTHWWRVKWFFLIVLATVNVSYSRELIRRVGILNPETVLKLLGPLVEILPIEGVIWIVVLAEGHVETFIPGRGLPAGGHIATLVPILLPPLRLWSVCVKGRFNWILLLKAIIASISRVHHHVWVRMAV